MTADLAAAEMLSVENVRCDCTIRFSDNSNAFYQYHSSIKMSAKDLWRSKDMSSCKLTANIDVLRVLLGNLIKTELVQFIDENE